MKTGEKRAIATLDRRYDYQLAEEVSPMAAHAATAVKLGWLWFDNDPKTSLEDKVRQASRRYRQKFGHSPWLCYVSQNALAEPQVECGSLQVRTASNVLPGHFLFVVEGKETAIS